MIAAFPSVAFGAEGNYEAMLLTCIDPRFPEPTIKYMEGRHMVGKYSQFTFAGASIGVVAPAFKTWAPAFWDNLAASIHIYSFNGCTTAACYDRIPAKVAHRVPLYIGEFGPDLTAGYSSQLDSNCPSSDVGDTGFDRKLIQWARAHGASWTAWTWNPWGDCWALIRGFGGRPTSPYGDVVRRALHDETQSALA
jgi:hypothetical protein